MGSGDHRVGPGAADQRRPRHAAGACPLDRLQRSPAAGHCRLRSRGHLAGGEVWWVEPSWNTAQQWIRLLDVVAVSTAAVLVAIVRVHREEHLMRLAAIAETAQRAILPTVPATLDGVHTACR